MRFYVLVYFLWAAFSSAIGVFLSFFVKAPNWLKNYLADYSNYVISMDALCFSVIFILLGALCFFYKSFSNEQIYFINLKRNIFIRFLYKFFLLAASIGFYFMSQFGGSMAAPKALGGNGVHTKGRGEIFELFFYFDFFGVSLFIAFALWATFYVLSMFFQVRIFPKLGF